MAGAAADFQQRPGTLEVLQVSPEKPPLNSIRSAPEARLVPLLVPARSFRIAVWPTHGTVRSGSRAAAPHRRLAAKFVDDALARLHVDRRVHVDGQVLHANVQ